MQHLRANTEVIVTVGPFVDVGDGFTPQTDITLGGDEAELIKHGSTTVVDISGATWAAVTNCRGYYSLTLTTGYTDTEGLLAVIVQDDSDCLPVKQEYMVLSEAAWDSLYGAKDDGFMDVNIKTVGRADTQETEANNLESACANYSATRGLSGTALPAAVADAAGGLPISAAGSLLMDTLADWVNGGRLDLILDIIAADVVNIDGDAMRGTDGANTTVPDAAGVAPTAVEIRQEIDSNSTRLDADITSRSPASEYDTEMARITGNVALASGVDLTHIMGTILTEGGAGRLAASLIKLLDVATPLLVASDVMRGTDSAALASVCTEARLQALTDWINGGRLDLILDIIAADTTTDIPALIATAQADLDLLTGADGATLATAQGNYAPNKVVPDAAGTAPTDAEIVTAIEADGGDLSSLMEALVNKLLITEASGNAEIFNDAGVSQGTVAAAFTSVAGVTQRKRMVI